MVTVGVCEQYLVAAAQRHAPWLRSAVAGLCCLFSLLDAETADRVAACAVAVLVLVSPVVRLHQPEPAKHPALLAGDAALAAVVGMSQLWLGPAPTASWTFATVSIMTVTCHFEWAQRKLTPWAMIASAVTAYGCGHLLAGGGVPVAACVRLVVQAVLAGASLAWLRHVAQATDRLGARAADRRVKAVVAGARRAADRAYLATLHDTASTTLTMISAGRGADLGWVRQQARRDLEMLAATPSFPTGDVDLPAMLAGLDTGPGREVRLTAGTDLVLPAPAGVAIYQGMVEALRNAHVHSGDPRPEIGVARQNGQVVAWVSDRGAGFEAADVGGHCRGISHSIVLRAAGAGVRADIESIPGAGTTVRWTWPSRTPNDEVMDTAHGQSAEQTTQNLYGVVRGMLLAVAMTVQFGLSAPGFLAAQRAAGANRVEAAVFIALTLLALIVVVTTATTRHVPGWARVFGVGLLLACSTAIALAVSSRSSVWAEHWSFGLIGWYGLALLCEVGLAWQVAFLGVQLAVFAAPWLLAQPGLSGLAQLGVSAASITGFQIGVAMAAGVLRPLAASAHAASQSQEQLAAHEATAEATLRAHERRYHDLQSTTVPLLGELAAGRLDPAAAPVRRRCAVEAARIRRLLCAGLDPQTPGSDTLLAEVCAVIDIAERRCVAVDLSMRGIAQAVPAPVCQELLALINAGLLTATHAARVTLMYSPDSVQVSVVSDGAPAQDTLLAAVASAASRVSSPQVSVRTHGTAEQVWMEASWAIPG